MFRILFLALLLTITISTPYTHAAPAIDRVVAVIGDHVITRQDLDTRFQLVLRQLPKQLSAEQQKKLYAQTLNVLIDEELKRRKAEELRISVKDEEVDARMAALPKQAGISPEDFQKITKGLEGTLREQIKAELLWDKVVEREVTSRINVSTEEIDQLIKNLAADNKVKEINVSQIFIREGDDAEKQIQAIYTKLQEGADFDQTAREESQHSSAVNGGNMGWFKAGELAPVMEQAMQGLTPGNITLPIRSGIGWHIVKLNDARLADIVTMDPIHQRLLVLFSVQKPETKEQEKTVRDILEKIRSKAKTLSDAEEILQDENLKPLLGNSRILGWLEDKDVPTQIAPDVEDLKPGETSKVFENAGTLNTVLLVQERMEISNDLQKYRERVRERIVTNRTELSARRYLRDLRRSTFVDVRL